MEPEEIDKIFKDRLNGMPVLPSADAWMRLQQKMEPPKKERTMWIYYAAASLVILLLSGLIIFQNYNQKQVVTVAQTEMQKQIENKIDKLPVAQATPEKPAASTSKTIALEDKSMVELEKKVTGNLPKEAFKIKRVEKGVAHKSLTKQKKNNSLKPGLPAEPVKTEDNPRLVAQHKAPEKMEDKLPVTAFNPVAGSVVQVLVKQDNAAELAAVDEEITLRENISRKGALLKNIYKQARNLKNGEPVELATLGLNTEKINAETQNIKQKINKVISL